MYSEFQIRLWIGDLDAKPARVKYGSSKALRLAGRESPELVVPYFDRFVELLNGDNTIQRWNAIWTVGHLARADREGRIDRILRSFCAPIRGPQMIAAANTIGAVAEIAAAKPYLADRIAGEILKVEQAIYATPECRNVAIGHAIRALEGMFSFLKRRRAVVEFVSRQLHNTRPGTRRKAEHFLRRWRNEPKRA